MGSLTLVEMCDINRVMANNHIQMNTKRNWRFDAGLISPVCVKALVFSRGMFVSS
jgi:hypothetical protein